MTDDQSTPRQVLLTGASGFVGGYTLRRLIAGGFQPVCVVRDPERFGAAIHDLPDIKIVRGDVVSGSGLAEAAAGCSAAIHLVGIIMERGQTFSEVHFQGTKNVVRACLEAGIKRYVHMSALGTRADAASKYHQTKYAAEQHVKKSGLQWTIMRPSIVHGPEGEFMELMKTFVSSMVPPVIPYFGNGSNRLQPVDVRDVAECFVTAIDARHTVHRSYDLGGPRSYSWKELYQLCKKHIPGSKSWKPMVGQPVIVAKLLASTVMRVPAPTRGLDKLRFDMGQVQMSQEDSVCDVTPAERDLDITFRDFETELAEYADQIR